MLAIFRNERRRNVDRFDRVNLNSIGQTDFVEEPFEQTSVAGAFDINGSYLGLNLRECDEVVDLAARNVAQACCEIGSSSRGRPVERTVTTLSRCRLINSIECV